MTGLPRKAGQRRGLVACSAQIWELVMVPEKGHQQEVKAPKLAEPK
jgi:hypothetical protein